MRAEILTLLTLLAMTPSAAAETPPGDRVPADVRAVADLSAMPLVKISADAEHTWVLIDISPAHYSGSATAPGSEIDMATGELTVPPGSAPAILEGGSWHLLAVLAGEAGGVDPRPFHWTVPQPVHRSGIEPRDLYSPFAAGGVVVGRLPDEVRDGREIDPAFLIPAEWRDQVEPAVELIRARPGRFDAGSRELAPRALKRLLDGDNGLLALAAYRALRDAGRLDERSLRELLLSPEPFVQACVVRDLLTGATASGDGTPHAEVSAAIGEAPDGARLGGIALGIFTATIETRRASELERNRDLLGEVDKKLATIESPGEAESYIAALLSKVGIESGE